MKTRILLCAGLTLVFVVNGYYAQDGRNGCFSANYMVSCLSIMCEFGGSCPGDPDAICRIERPNKCAGCEQVWYRKDGTRAECGSRQNLKLCPGGEPVVHCKVDSCKWPCTHPAFKDKPCRQSFCGRCQAEYLIGDSWLKCPRSTTRFSGETLPIDVAVRERTTKACMHIPCPLDACVGQTCLNVPDASCRPDGCDKCLPAWYLGNKPVDCLTGDIFPPVAIEPIDPLTGDRRLCAGGERLMTCSDNVCLGETCPNYPSAVCKPDGCGQCKATWYVDDILVDCFNTECPANVIRYKCVVDPCIYFSHYCPAAECRATECGRCEAKFYVGEKEISCVQPPKKCLPEEHTMVCPWYTCPTTVCPSNLNLMCRINPCGLSCRREWVNVKTGLVETCRTFEKPPTTNKKFEKVFMEDPLARFHDTDFVPAEKPYIEVKKESAKVQVKPFKDESDPSSSVAVPMKSDQSLVTAPIDNKSIPPFDIVQPFEAGVVDTKHSPSMEILKSPVSVPISMMKTLPSPMESIPVKSGQTLITAPIGIKNIPPSDIGGHFEAVPVVTKHNPSMEIHKSAVSVPISMMKSFPMDIPNLADSVPIPMMNSVPMEILNQAAPPVPLMESLPVNIEKTEATLPIPMKAGSPNQNHRPPMLKPSKVRSSPINTDKGNVVMLGGNDPELNSLLLELIGINTMNALSNTANSENVQPLDIMAPSSSKLPQPIKSKKPILHTRNSRFENQPILFNRPAMNDGQLHDTRNILAGQQELLTNTPQIVMPKQNNKFPIHQQMEIDKNQMIGPDFEIVPLVQQPSVIKNIDSFAPNFPPHAVTENSQIQVTEPKRFAETSVQVHSMLDKTHLVVPSSETLPQQQQQQGLDTRNMILTNLETVPTLQTGEVTGSVGDILQVEDKMVATQTKISMPVFGSTPLINQNPTFEKSPVTVELLNKGPVILKKKAGKPIFNSDQGLLKKRAGKPNFLRNQGLLKKKAGKPKMFKALYPELELIEKSLDNKRSNAALIKGGAHLHVPIKKDRSKPKPVENAKPPLNK